MEYRTRVGTHTHTHSVIDASGEHSPSHGYSGQYYNAMELPTPKYTYAHTTHTETHASNAHSWRPHSRQSEFPQRSQV